MTFEDFLMYGGAGALGLILVAVIFSSDGKARPRSDGGTWKASGASLILASVFGLIVGLKYETAIAGIQNVGLLQDRNVIFSAAFVSFIGGLICAATGSILSQSFDGGNEQQD